MSGALLNPPSPPTGRPGVAASLASLCAEPTWRLLLLGLGGDDASGRLAARLEEGEVIGVDPSPAMHRLAQRRHWAALQDGRLKLLISPIERLPLPEAWIDVVTIVDTLQLAPSAEAAARELARVARPGAPVGCVTHDWAAEAKGCATDAWLETAAAAFEAFGFEDVSISRGLAGGEPALILRARRQGASTATRVLAAPRRVAA